MKGKGKGKKEQWRRQGEGDLIPQSSRQDISIRLNDRCKKRFKKNFKAFKNVKNVTKFF